MTAGSSMAAMSLTGAPQWEQEAMSMANTRLSNWAQLRRARVEAEAVSPSASTGADPSSEVTTQIRKRRHEKPAFAKTVQRIKRYIIKHAT